MKSIDIQYKPLHGKTYTLFGSSDNTENYYRLIKELADEILMEHELIMVLETLKKFTSGIRFIQKIRLKEDEKRLISQCIYLSNEHLLQFTREASNHLKTLPLLKRRDRRLATTEEQYHLYMFEIELTNRLNRMKFLKCDKKISLQPYCLQDFGASCKAESDEFDYRCKGCSRNCYQNFASQVLKENGIESYIWMEASISGAAKEAYKNGQTFGILGIACIPELVMGMRRCTKYNIPAVGIPLNANRCVRWFGEFHPNSVDLQELEKLVKDS